MEGGLFPPGPPRGAPPRGRVSEVDTGGVVPRGPVSDDVLQAINERATAIFSSHKHKVSGMLEAPQGLYALALVGAMLGLNQKQLDSELQMAQKVGRRALSFEDFMTAVEAMVSLHGALAQQQVKRLPNNDMSKALRSAFDMYTKLNVGGFVGGDSRMNSNQFTKMCNDAGMMEPNGPASVSMLQLCWASCKATFGSTRLQYSQFLKILGALAAELSGDVLLLVAGLGLQLPTVPPLRNGFRKPDAGEVNLNVPKPELVQGMGAHMAANDEYEKFVEGGMGRRDPLRANASPIKARSSMNGGAVPNWVKAMQADQGGGSVMTSGQDIRGIPVIETPDSDDDMPKKPQPRKSSMAPQPPADGPQRVAASPMRGPRGGKLPQMGGGGGGSETMSAPMDEYLIKADAPNYGGRGNQIDITESTGPMTVRPRESLRNGPRGDPDSPTINPLEPSILTGAGQRMRKSLIQPEAMQEVVQQQQVAVKALETKVEEQQQREKDLFTRVQLLTEKLQEAQVAAAITVKPGCPGAPLSMPDVPEGKPRTVVSGRCPLTDQVDKLTQQMAEVMARLSALESIRIESKSEGDAKTRNPVAARAPTFDDSGALAPSTGWTPPGMGAARRPNGDEAPALVGALQPANATQGEWMSRLLLNLDKRVRSMEAASGKPDTDKDEEALAEVLRQLQAYEAGRRQPAPPGAAPITPVPGADPFSPAFSMVDHRGRPVPAPAPGAPPVLLPTGDPELDKRLRALADDMRNKNATVGLLLDMFNQTRAEQPLMDSLLLCSAALLVRLRLQVASLSAQLADMRRAGGAPAPGEPAEAMGMAPSPGGKARNPIKVVDSGFMAPEVHLTAAPARKAAEPGAEAALGPLAPQLENVIAENSSIKMAMRELCAAVGVTPPPLLAAAEPGRAGPTPGAGADAFEMSPWGAPGRRNLKDEAQEVKRNVETVQQDVGELKKVVEQMRAGYGEWPQPLRAPQPGAAPGAAAAQVPDMEPIQAVAAGAGRNPIQVTAGAPLHSVDPMLVPKDRRGLTPLGEPGAVGGLPDAQLGHLMDDLQKLKAFVGLGDAVASMPPLPGAGGAAPGMGPTAGAGAVELGAWADAGRGPRPLKETVQTVAQDVDALRKHVKAMDAALRTNINNTNNMTSFLNTNAPALMAAADAAAKEAEEAKAGGRNPIKVAAGGVEAGGALAPGQKGLLPMQTAGNFEAGVVDPGEYQALRDQVRNMATYLGAPAAATAPGLGAAPGAKPGLEPMAQAAGGPWGAPGRAGSGGAGGYGPGGAAGGTLPEQMENLQKQVAAMGRAMMAAGMDVDSFQGGNAAAAAAAGGNAAAEEMASNVKSRNAIGVVPGMAAVEVQQKFMSPGRGPLATPEGGTAALEPSVSALQDEMRAMKAYLGIEAVPPGIKAAGRIAAPGLEPMQAAGVPGDSWGTSGRSARDFSEVRAGGALGDMARDLDNIKRRQADVEEALRVAGVPVAAGAQGGGGGAGGDGSGAAGGGGGKTRNPIMVASGYVTGPEGDKKGFQGPGRPLQPLGTIEGVPEPVISHLGALQDDVRRMAQFLGMTPAMAAAPALPGGAPGGIAPIAGTEAAAAPVSWGSAPPARAAPKIQNIGDLVNDVENYKARQQGVERVLRSMGAQIPWPEDAPAPAPAAGAAPGDDAAPGESPVAVSRQRNAIAVNAGPVEYGGALAAPAGRGGLAPLASGAGAEALSPVVAAMADDLRRVQAVLGLCPAAAAATAGLPGAGGAPGVSPMAGRDDGVSGNWGVAGRDIPRWPNDQPKNLVEIARDVDDNRKRVAAIIDAMKAANIPIPPALAAEAAGDDSSTPEGAAAAEQRRRNAISVSAGPLQSGGPGAGQFMSPGRKLPGMEGLPEPVQAELAKMADDIRKVHTYLGMNPAVAAAPALAAPAVAAMVPIAAGHDDGVSGSWGVAGREGPRGPGEPPKSMGEVVKELDDNKRRMAAIIDAMKAANIPVPAGVEADGAGAAPGESPVAVSRQRNAIAVSAGPMLPGGPLGAAPGRNLPALEGLPEPAAVEMARMADELKRVQAILANSPAVAATPAAAAALAQAGAPQPGASGDGVSGDWGVGGRPPASGAPEKNVKELIREVDNNKRRIEALENFVRGGGSGMGAGSHGDGSGGDADDKSSPEGGTPEQQQRRRNAVNVTAGGVDGGSPMFAPGRVPASLQGLPEPAQAELAKMADEIKQMKSFMDMGPPARAKGPGADPVQPVMAAVPGGGFDSWGGPGRDPRSAPEAPRNMGEVVKDLDENKRRVAALETAMRAAGIPVPSPDGEAPAAGEAAGEAPAQRKRNPIMVSAGPAMVTPGGFNAPQRALAGAAPEGPAAEPLQPHMGSMADDIRQMKAFLNMGPPVLAPAMPALPGAAPAQGVMPMPGRDDGVSGNWGVAGRPPRQAGEPPRDMGEVVKDVQDNNRRVAAMIDAMKAANIPIPPALAAEAAALPAESPAEVQARKQRNPIMVSAGGVESGPGFAAPSRELKAAMAGLPEPLQAELAKMADDMQRMKIFMNGTPAVAAAPGLAAPAVAAVMPVAGRDDGVSGNWGVAGRPPRQAGEPPRDMGEAMKDVQDNNRRVAAMIDAMKAANIPIPPALAAEAAALPAESPAEVQARKQRNPIMVSGGPMDSQGFTAPAGRQPAMEGVPEPVKAELARLNDDVRRMQAALATVPALAVAPALVAAKAGAGPNAGRDDGVSGNWGVPGRDPRGPGEAPAPSVSDLSRELDRYKERTNALADAMQAAGIPVPPPAAPGEAPPDEGTPEAAARKRNAIAVSPAHYGGPDQQGFAGPGRGAAGAGPDAAPLPARVDNLADELKAMKAFLGMPAEAQAPKLGPDGKPLAPGAEAVEGGPWAGPGRVPIAKAVENVTRDMDNVKDKLKELDRALKAAGMGGQLPREMGGPGGGAGGGPDDRGPEAAAARQRNAVAVMPGLQAPNDPQAFSGVKTREAPPIDNPQFVDGPQYDKLRGDVEKIKALMGPAAVAAVPVPGKEGLAPVPGAAEALGPWANKTIRQAADDTKNAVDGVQADLGDMKKRMADMAEAMKALEGPLRAAAVAGPDDGKGGPGGPGAAAGRNPIAVNAGMVPTGPGSALTGPGRQGGPDGPDGNNPVTVDAEEIRNLKKAVEDLQNTVGQPAPAAAPEAAKKPKTLKEDTDDIKKFVRAMGKDVGAMGNDMQALKKHLDDVEGAMNRALANLAAELAKMKAERDADDEGGPRRDQRKLENAGDSMADTINAMAALNAAQQQQLARAGDGNRNDDIDALNEAMRQSENQLARLLAFLKQDVMDRFAVHEKTLIRMAKQIDYIQRLLKGEFDDQREAARDAGSSLTVSTPEGHTMATYDS
ncbi:hypothetical protein HXX76_013272 [Chlamydomonas incerta]|uniref:Uncharacterized protein n=1 Tax=Chlamydomonas incerta TaxID=51695 RepID=A0A835SFM1_CHLIN|nr:hypothetical protein HXX76_013272 [Chlamydomonas incerta]|eukprot:KAG2426084.1 hypothetical protein HXX76_013272 [Chlamydomonas incerta]